MLHITNVLLSIGVTCLHSAVERVGSAISVTLVLQLTAGKAMKLDASTFIERDAWVDALQVSI
jgi:hypothetical protein